MEILHDGYFELGNVLVRWKAIESENSYAYSAELNDKDAKEFNRQWADDEIQLIKFDYEYYIKRTTTLLNSLTTGLYKVNTNDYEQIEEYADSQAFEIITYPQLEQNILTLRNHLNNITDFSKVINLISITYYMDNDPAEDEKEVKQVDSLITIYSEDELKKHVEQRKEYITKYMKKEYLYTEFRMLP